ncbi:hypothetical protein Tco_1115533 [Tanacetum coccineum]
MYDPNMTMEEYIKLEEEKAHRRGRVFNWEAATYGKIRVDDDFYDLRYVETEFPAIALNDELSSEKTLSSIVFNETLTSEAALSCEPTVSPLNVVIDFRISFDESDNEDCTENDNDKVNMPFLPSPESTVSYINDLDYFNNFEKEFPAIIYNDAQMSKLDFFTEPTLSPQHIDEFDLKDETSLSECDEVEQNVLYFNDLFYFNVIYPDDSKSDEDNDDDKIDIEHSSGDLSVIPLPNVINNNDRTRMSIPAFRVCMCASAALLECPQHIDEFDLKDETSLSEYDEVEQIVLYFNDLFPFNIIRPDDLKSDEDNDNNEIGIVQSPRGLEYTDVDIADFESRLAKIYRREVHRVQVFDFEGLLDLMAEGLSARMIIAPPLPVIDLAELVRLQICVEIDDTWAWVALGPERQPDDVAGAPEAAEDAPIDDEDGQAVLEPVQMPHPPTPPVAASLWRPAGRLIRHSMRPFMGARQQPSRDILDAGLNKTGRPRKRNINEYWWRIYKSGDLKVLES